MPLAFLGQKRRPLRSIKNIEHLICTNTLIFQFTSWQLALLAEGITQAANHCQNLLTAIASACSKNTLEQMDIGELGVIKTALLSINKPPLESLALVKEELENSSKIIAVSPSKALQAGSYYQDFTFCPNHIIKIVQEKVSTNKPQSFTALLHSELILALICLSNSSSPNYQTVSNIKKKIFEAKELTSLSMKDLVALAPFAEEHRSNYEKAVSKIKLQEATTAELAQLAQSFQRYAHPPVKLLQRVLDTTIEKIGSCSVKQLAHIGESFSVLIPEQNAPFYKALKADLTLRDASQLQQFESKVAVALTNVLVHDTSDLSKGLSIDLSRFSKWFEACRVEELTTSELLMLTKNYSNIHPKNSDFCNRLDITLREKLNKNTSWQQSDWDIALQSALHMVQIGHFHSKTVGLFFRKLKRELAVIKQENANEQLLAQAWLLTGSDVVATIWQKQEHKSTLQLETAWCEQLLLLYARLSDARPELFDEPLVLLLNEIQEQWHDKAILNWEKERSL